LPEDWFTKTIIKGGIGFAKEILDISIEQSFGEKTAFEKTYTEADLNYLITRVLRKIGLSDTITEVRITLRQDAIASSGLVKLGKVAVKGSGEVKGEAVRGGIKYTVMDYKFTLGNTAVPLPVPRLLVDRITGRMNVLLTRKNLHLVIEEIRIMEGGVTLRGVRVGKEKAKYEKGK
jgi:hypothetical protein